MNLLHIFTPIKGYLRQQIYKRKTYEFINVTDD